MENNQTISGKFALIQPKTIPDVIIDGNLIVKGEIINEKKEEPISQWMSVEVLPGYQKVIPLKNGIMLSIHSPAVKPEQPVNVYDWTISLPICGTILLWAIFITIWKGHLKVEQEKNFPPLNIDIPMPKVKPPLVPPPQGRSTLKWSEK